MRNSLIFDGLIVSYIALNCPKIGDFTAYDRVSIKCTLCQGHYDFFLFRFLLYICLLCRGIKVMPLIDCFHLLL